MRKTLPKGAKRLNSSTLLKVGNWRAQFFDASLVDARGLKWKRVKNGLGDRGDREDWLLDVPGVTVSVMRWKGDRKWTATTTAEYIKLDEAMEAAIRDGLYNLEGEIARAEARVKELHKAQKSLARALAMKRRVQG